MLSRLHRRTWTGYLLGERISDVYSSVYCQNVKRLNRMHDFVRPHGFCSTPPSALHSYNGYCSSWFQSKNYCMPAFWRINVPCCCGLPKSYSYAFVHTVSNEWNRFKSPTSNYGSPGEFNNRQAEPKKKSELKTRLWRLAKLFLLGTGAFVWIVALIAYVSLEDVKIEELQDDNKGFDLKRRALVFFDVKNLSNRKYFKKVLEDDEEVDKAFLHDGVGSEIHQKGDALMQLWDQLKGEDSIKSHLGTPAHIIGYLCTKEIAHRLSNDYIEAYNSKRWSAQCLVEGPLSIAILSMMFERSDTDGDWIPTNVHLESLQTSGDVLCNVSRPLPLGVKNYTRLSN